MRALRTRPARRAGHDLIRLHRAARRGRRSAGAAAAVLVALSLTPLPAAAVPSGITFSAMTPVTADGASVIVAPTAADDPTAPPTFQLKADIYVDNTDVSSADVSSVRFTYPGSGIPPRTYTPLVFDGDGNASPFSIPGGGVGRVAVHDGLDRDLPMPLPEAVHISVYFAGDPEPLTIVRGLATRPNPVPNGAHFFPAKATDLAPGEYWSVGTRHTVDAGGGGGILNPSTRSQRYGYDFGIVAWDGGTWSNVLPGSPAALADRSNSDYRIWNAPLYAMSDGTIVSCYRGEMDHQPDGFDDITFENGGGNSLWILHGDDKVLYAHFRFGTIPTELCPNDGQNDGLSIPVEAGQFLGRVGNTGRSTNPHLHLHAEDVQATGPDASGIPLQFLNVRALADDTTLTNLGDSPTLEPLHGLTLHRHSLVLPNPCGFDVPNPGGAEISRHGIPAECYQDVFHQYTAAGYAPTFVDGYDVGGAGFFNATFRSGMPATVAYHGLTGSQYQDAFDELTGDGYRLHQVDSYRVGGGVRYAAIFQYRDGPAWVAFHGLDSGSYELKFAEFADAGFVPVNISTVEVGGELFWTGLWEQAPVDGWTTFTVPAASYQAVFDDNVAAGRIPVYVHGFATGAGAYLTGIWVEPMGASTLAVHGLSSADYQQAFEDNLEAGRFTRAVSGYEQGGRARFAAVWRARPDTTLTVTPPTITNQTSAAFGFTTTDPFATTRCSLDLGAWSPCDAPHVVDGLGEGNHTLRVRAVDREGLRDLTPASHGWLVDLTPPDAAIISPEEGTKVVHGTPKEDPVETTTVIGWADVVAEASDALSGVATVAFDVDGVPVPASEVTQPTADTWSFVFEPAQKGTHTYVITVTVTDLAGNASTDTLVVEGTTTGKKP